MEIYRSHVLICTGTGCVASGSHPTKDALIEEIKNRGLEKEVKVVDTGCFGFCQFGPNMVIYPEGTFYCQVKPEDARELVEEHLVKGRILERLLYKIPEQPITLVEQSKINFFKYQERLVLRNCGHIDPESIEEYIAVDGYLGLAKALTEMKPAEVIEVIQKSELRGRGGGGFPTGVKWRFAAATPAKQKYIVCNGDEGDPGAFMNRSLLEGDPHTVIEGMAIAGYAIGADTGYVYIRAEYPIAIDRLLKALDQARAEGLLGKNIFDSGFNFDINIRLGAGAFVCGEETALLASIEGGRGEPRPRPPFPAVSGLWGKPTVINNVETLGNVPQILRNGWEWFASIGTDNSKGTKVFALAGKVINNGLVEVPMGMALGKIVYDIGGGIPGGKKFKAAQTGGPSGGCIPVEHLNAPIDYDSLQELGTIMGSGGLVVMDEDTCMVDLAKFFLEFVQDESCGKCAPCRIGTKRMLEILRRISYGEGVMEDLDLLTELAEGIKVSALCGLGQTAPNPVLSTLRYFREEYETHIKYKRCPASVCVNLFVSPCQNTCPAEIDVPIYIDLIKNKMMREAYKVIQADNPFPLVCGRVCHHPCEDKCRRNQLDTALAIRALKRFPGDYLLRNGGIPVPVPAEAKEAEVAVIGAGPAGLSAAFYLRKKGYPVTLFEALPVAGGMMAVGIPEYRLPKVILNQEIDVIKKMGVKIKTGVKLGRDISLNQLLLEGYKAIFIGVGAHKNQPLNLPGEELEGVLSGITFLREVNLNQAADLTGKRVAIIGGGNVAADAARSALRLGAKSVAIYYRRTRAEMPALPEEIVEIEKEGIQLNLLVAPQAIIGERGKVTGLTLKRMELGDFDRSGRRRPVAIADSDFTVEADVVIAAIGQVVKTDGLADNLKFSRWGTIITDVDSLATNIPGVFAGGDCVTGADTLIAAIAAGKKAASSIDKFLGGDGVIVEPLTIKRKISGVIIEEKALRQKVPIRHNIDGFKEMELGFTFEQALAEAERCLRCDVVEA
ncbi:NADH-quinone oxidoreductase subunit NuoF [Candidatus Acetothermia bacterium]|nr:NADH-quinone oxidoreductase subunit NuoF [Candidatus Acetothermia bacterium]MCI2427028.1 NADH-quinone oxidoreductase subunit NuoF [Candidatus Acetothermia bacterium]MCI2428135.1 NADH-quinone oxidoreductase subunit NuoF [Candidatus Acetothermia bacterium]